MTDRCILYLMTERFCRKEEKMKNRMSSTMYFALSVMWFGLSMLWFFPNHSPVVGSIWLLGSILEFAAAIVNRRKEKEAAEEGNGNEDI